MGYNLKSFEKSLEVLEGFFKNILPFIFLFFFLVLLLLWCLSNVRVKFQPDIKQR